MHEATTRSLVFSVIFDKLSPRKLSSRKRLSLVWTSVFGHCGPKSTHEKAAFPV
jgi:hypothetical protein